MIRLFITVYIKYINNNNNTIIIIIIIIIFYLYSAYPLIVLGALQYYYRKTFIKF